MPHIKVGKENSAKIEIHYKDHGKGKPAVLIHGFPLSWRAWEKQIPVLLDSGYRVIAYDRRGFGSSSKPNEGYDYETLTDDLHALIETLDLKDVTLIGHSMGTGEICRYLGKYGSERIERVALLSPIVPFLLKTADHPEGVEKKIFDGFQESILKDRLAYLTEFFSVFFNTDSLLGKRVSEEVLHFSWNVASAASPKGTHDCVKAWQTDFRKDVARIHIPCLIIQGDADRITPLPITGEAIKKTIPNSELMVIKGAPHGMAWTHAEEVNQALIRFLGARESTKKAG